MAAWSAVGEGLQLQVRLTPRGGRDAVDGVETLSDGRQVLKMRVRAAPTEGEANAALTALVAKALGVPRSQVVLAAGAGARLKRLLVKGDPAALAERLEAVLAKN